MEKYQDSPLATRQSRNSFARKPLHVLAKTPKPSKSEANEDENTPASGRETRRGLNSSRKGDKSKDSPDFCTSSPSAEDFSKMVSPPQVSMINKLTPKSNSAKKTTNVATKLPTESSSEDNSENSDTEGTDTPVSTRTRSRIKDTSKSTIVQRSQRSINQSVKTEDNTYTGFTYLLFVISAIAVGYLATQVYQETVPQEEVLGQPFKRFSRDLESIKAQYPKQNPRTWATFSSQIRRILYGKATQPSCILVMYNETASKTKSCLIQAFGTSLYYALNQGSTNQLHHIQSNTDLDKGQLYENVHLELIKTKTLVLHDIDQLQASTAMALHGICDEGYMPEDKLKPVVILTMRFFGKAANSDFELAANTIRDLWEKDLGTDKVHPLISRIASVFIKVTPEPNSKC